MNMGIGKVVIFSFAQNENNFFGVFLQKIWQIALLDNEHELVFSMLGSIQSQKYTKTSEDENVCIFNTKAKIKIGVLSYDFF